jgi:hypothetical protein
VTAVATYESNPSITTLQTRRRRSRTAELVQRSDAFVIYGGIMLLMLISSLDAVDFFDRPNGKSRYLILLLPFGAALWVRARHPSWSVREPTIGHVLVGIMVLIGLGGSLYGMILLNTKQGPLNVFVPMAVGLLLLLATDGPRDREVPRTTHLLGLIGFAYVIMNFLLNTGVLVKIAGRLGPLANSNLVNDLATSLKYRNASAAFVALAFACAIVERRPRRLLVLTVMYAVIFATYPSATQLLIFCGTALTLLLTSRRASALRTLVATSLILLITATALLNVNAVVRLSTTYFSEVNKANANSGRLDLAAAGIDEFKQSPLIGHLFSRDAVAVRLRDNNTLPFHDDFILFLAEGGLLGIALLVGWMAYTEITLLRRYREFMNAGDLNRARLIRVLLVMLNAFFIAIPFNPVMEGVTRTATIFGVWAIAMSLGRPQPAASDLDPLTPDSEAPLDRGLPAGTPGTSA